MIYAVSLATKGVISPCIISGTGTGEDINRGGGIIVKEECTKPKINVLSFKIEKINNIQENRIIIVTSLNVKGRGNPNEIN